MYVYVFVCVIFFSVFLFIIGLTSSALILLLFVVQTNVYKDPRWNIVQNELAKENTNALKKAGRFFEHKQIVCVCFPFMFVVCFFVLFILFIFYFIILFYFILFYVGITTETKKIESRRNRKNDETKKFEDT
jgi:hypothetical protein